jgi:N-acetylmuramoyl-L-alanine amidase
VDAGHGGIDRAGSRGNVPIEKVYTLAVSQKLAARLRGAGVNVVMTRNSDVFVGLQQRCNIANRTAAPSLSPSTSMPPPAWVPLAWRLTGSMAARARRWRLRASRSAEGHGNRGPPCPPPRLLRHPQDQLPAILIESGFLTNPGELSRISNPAFQDKLADGIAKGILARYR